MRQQSDQGREDAETDRLYRALAEARTVSGDRTGFDIAVVDLVRHLVATGSRFDPKALREIRGRDVGR